MLVRHIGRGEAIARKREDAMGVMVQGESRVSGLAQLGFLFFVTPLGGEEKGGVGWSLRHDRKRGEGRLGGVLEGGREDQRKLRPRVGRPGPSFESTSAQLGPPGIEAEGA